MQHIHSLQNANCTRPSVVTIGAFDGVHRGHQYLVKKLCDHAAANNQAPVVLTFFPHPEMVLRGFRPGFYLTMPDAKARLLGDLGVEMVVTHPFNDHVRQIRAAKFVDMLISNLKMVSLWVGDDFALGYKREGNVGFLRELGKKRGYDLRVVDLMDAGGERVSSTRVRDALNRGDVTEASRLLGRPYALPGQVVGGAKRGRSIGFPTANLAIQVEQASPARGVYAGWAHFDDQTFPTVVNIGRRPTFDGSTDLVIEAHLLNFSGDLYGKDLTIDFVAHLREEKKFNGIDALVSQIQADIQQAEAILSRVQQTDTQPPSLPQS